MGGPESKPADQESASETMPATVGHRSLMLSRDSGSDSEEELPSLRERLRAKSSPREPPLCQTNLLSVFRSVRTTTTASSLPYSSSIVTTTSEGKRCVYMKSGCTTGRETRVWERLDKRDYGTYDTGLSAAHKHSSGMTGINLSPELESMNSVSSTESSGETRDTTSYSTGSIFTQSKSNECNPNSEREINSQACRDSTEQICSQASVVTAATVDVRPAQQASSNVTHCRLSPKKIALSTSSDLPVEECIVLVDSSDESESELPLSERLRCKHDIVAKEKTGVRVFPCVEGVSEESGVVRKSSRGGSSHNPIVIS